MSDIGWLRLGSLWTDGIPEDYPDYQRAAFELSISDKHEEIHRGYDKIDQRSYYIRRSGYRIWHDVSAGTFLLLNVKGRYQRLIIPCFEIFRFYYQGISGKFGSALIDGSHMLHRYQTVDEPNSSWPNTNGVAHIRLGRSVDNADRIEIARATFSELARRNIEMLIPRMGTIYAPSGLTIGFPFEGNTTLTVQGIACHPRTFLVLTIEQCTGAMPFNHLTWARASSNKQDRPLDPNAKIRKGGITHAPSPADLTVPPPYTQRLDPSDRDIPFSISGLLHPDRYGGTFTEAEVPRAPIKSRRVSRVVYCQRTYGEAYSSGIGERDARARALILDTQKARTLSDQLVEFRKTITRLCIIDKRFKVDYLEHPLLPPHPRDAAKPDRWAWSFLDTDRTLLRRASVAIVLNLRCSYVLIEIERRPVLKGLTRDLTEYFRMAIFIPPQRSTAQADIKKLLEFIVVHRGIVSTKQRELAYTLPGWRVDGFLHIPEDEEDRAVRLRDKLDSVAMSSTAQ